MNQSLGATEIVLPRQQHILPVVLLSSIGLVFLLMTVWETAMIMQNVHNLGSGGGFNELSIFDVLDIGAVAVALIVGLSVLMWIVLRVIRYRFLSGSAYRISQAGIQFPAPVAWQSYEVPFPTLIPW